MCFVLGRMGTIVSVVTYRYEQQANDVVILDKYKLVSKLNYNRRALSILTGLMINYGSITQ